LGFYNDAKAAANKGLPKYGQDNQIFSFISLSAPVPGWTNFSRQLCVSRPEKS